jgi:prepilin-type N-terminal cleavage/methylation domain-containing protein
MQPKVKLPKHAHKSAGFSLLEVLVAVIILSGAMVMLSSSWSGSLMAFRKSQTLTTVAYLLKRKMTELEVKYRPESGLIPPEEEEGNFGDSYKDFRWTMKSKQLEFPDLSSILTSKDGGANEMMITTIKQMTEQISQNIREMTLTVYAKAGKRELEYSVTAYNVNFAAGVNIPGLPSAGGAGGPAGGATGGTTAGATAGTTAGGAGP